MSANTEQRRQSLANWAIPDPGASGTISSTRSGTCAITTATAESRTVAAPVRLGTLLTINMETDGGDCTVACTNYLGGDDSFILSAVGQFVTLRSIYTATDTLGWEAVESSANIWESGTITTLQTTDVSIAGLATMTQAVFASGGLGVTAITADTGQASNIATAVAILNFAGTFNTQATSQAAGAAEESFAVTNAGIAVTDIPVIAAKYNGTTGLPIVYVSDVAAGSFTITIGNLHASEALNGDFDINYFIIKCEVA